MLVNPYHTLWCLTNLSNPTTTQYLSGQASVSVSLVSLISKSAMHGFIYSTTNLMHTYSTHCIHSLHRGLQWSNDSWLGSGISLFHVACMRGNGLSWNGQQKSKGTEVTSKVWRGTPSHDPYFLSILEKSPNSLNFLRHSPLTRIESWKQTGWYWDFFRRQQYHPQKQTGPKGLNWLINNKIRD